MEWKKMPAHIWNRLPIRRKVLTLFFVMILSMTTLVLYLFFTSSALNQEFQQTLGNYTTIVKLRNSFSTEQQLLEQAIRNPSDGSSRRSTPCPLRISRPLCTVRLQSRRRRSWRTWEIF